MKTPPTPAQIDRAIEKIKHGAPEELTPEVVQIAEYLAHTEREVLTHHSSFVKLLIHVLLNLANNVNETITHPNVIKRLSAMLSTPFPELYNRLADLSNDAIIHAEMARMGRKRTDFLVNRHNLEITFKHQYPPERFGDLWKRCVDARMELHLEKMAKIEGEMAHPSNDLTDRLMGKKKDWNPAKAQRAVIDMAYFLLTKYQKHTPTKKPTHD